jgi:tetratricopeptide (TPR) repeat protein
MKSLILIGLIAMASLTACGGGGVTARARPAPVLSDATRAGFEASLAAARAAYEADPKNVDHIVWYGRRLAYLWRFEDAIDVFTDGLKIHPESVKLLRHRGHRYITIRNFDRAAKDLQHAADLIRENRVPDEIEPDGLPNARNTPLSTLHDNVYYHLALTRYLRGQFEKAAEAWRAGLQRVKPNDDMLVAYTFWLYLAESRSGRPERAAALLSAITPSLDIIENHAYWQVLRVAKGELTEDAALGVGVEGVEGAGTDRATLLHGLGALALLKGDLPRARTRFEECMKAGQWPAFGSIAAETELARMMRGRGAPAEPVTQKEILRDIQRERQQYR